ncbi:MAG: hypothetical protein ACJ75J_10870 [Cytophagaceae bacterium]
MKCLLYIVFVFSALSVFGQVDELKGKITDQRSGQPVQGTIVFFSFHDDTLISVTSDTGGFYSARVQELPALAQVHSPGYAFYEQVFEIKPPSTDDVHIIINFQLARLTCIGGNVFIIPNPVFSLNSSAPSKESLVTIEKMSEALKENTGLTLQITGYADSHERSASKLARKRAETIYGMILQKVPAAKLKKSSRVMTGKSEEERIKNRKAEFEILQDQPEQK